MSLIGLITVGVLLAQHASPGSPPASPNPPAAEDNALVAAVLEDLFNYRGKDSPIDSIFSPNPLTLDPEPAHYSTSVDRVLERQYPERWSELSSSERVAIGEAARDLVRRLAGPAARFFAGSEHVPLYSGNGNPKDPFSFRKNPIVASLPGYSRDRSLAIVTLSIPWSIHGCSGKYVMTASEDGWRVRVREFVCYM